MFRGLPNTRIAADTAAMNAGDAGVNAGNAVLTAGFNGDNAMTNAGNSVLASGYNAGNDMLAAGDAASGTMARQAAIRNQGFGVGSSLYGDSVGATESSANILNAQFANQNTAYQNQISQEQADWKGLGTVGRIGGALYANANGKDPQHRPIPASPTRAALR